MIFPGFVGPAYTARSPNFAAESLVNLYLEAGNATTKSPAMLLGTPGLSLFTTLAGGSVRGLYTASGGRCFAVCGTVLAELHSDGTTTPRGDLVSASGVVSMADNGLELIVVDGTSAGYLLTFSTNTYAAITDDAFYGADRVAYFDGYFVLNRPGTQQLYISGLYAGATYDGTEFASDEASPDPIVSLEVQRRELVVLGTRSGQLWFDSGGVDFPLSPIAGTSFTYGCLAAQSLRSLAGQFFWLATDEAGARIVVRLEGYEPKRISTHALEFALGSYTRVDDAIAYTMTREGHPWYILCFPSANATWAFDAATNLWFALADLDPSTGLFQRHRVEQHAYAFGQHLVAGQNDGRVYVSDFETFTNAGDPLVRQRRTPFLHNDRKLLFHSVFEVDLQTGVGLDAGLEPGSDPQILMRFSDDGARTWSHELWVSAGPIGQYLTRAIWRRLGRSRQRTYEVTIADPVRVAILGARVEVS